MIDVQEKTYHCPSCQSKRTLQKDSRGNFEVITDDVHQKIIRPDSKGMQFWGNENKRYVTGTFGSMVMEIR